MSQLGVETCSGSPMFDHDDHTHSTLHDLIDCVANQRRARAWQYVVVLLVSLLVIGYWVVR